MSCGHSCKNFCHVYEITETDTSGHENIKCIENCAREKECGHPCDSKCF